MDITMICPRCGSIGVEVSLGTVRCLLKDSERKKIKSSHRYFLCTDSECKIAYFSNEMFFEIGRLTVKIWYKNDSDDVPICYCSDLTRGEIKQAVKNGCQTIADVQKYTGKNITGQCLKRNPTGKCCRNVFLREIEKWVVLRGKSSKMEREGI